MKKQSLLVILTLFFIGFSVTFSYSQTSTKINPYSVGEVLRYDAKVSKLKIPASIAELSFTVSNAPDSQNYLVKAEAKSKGSLLKIFRFRFLQNIESTVDEKKFTVIKTVKHDEQGDDRVRDSEANFNYEEKTVTYVETDPKDLNRPPRKIASTITNETYDMISAIYLLRQLPLAIGKSFEMNVSDSGLIYKIPVRVTGREQQNSILGKTWCFRLEPQVFGEGRMLEQKGSMIIWITDDNRRIPIRSQISTDVKGIELNVEVKLRKISK